MFPWKTQFVLPCMHLNRSRLHHHTAPRSRTQSKMHLITRASCWTGGFVWSRACVYLTAGKEPGLLSWPCRLPHHSCSPWQQCSPIRILSLLMRHRLGPPQRHLGVNSLWTKPSGRICTVTKVQKVTMTSHAWGRWGPDTS